MFIPFRLDAAFLLAHLLRAYCYKFAYIMKPKFKFSGMTIFVRYKTSSFGSFSL